MSSSVVEIGPKWSGLATRRPVSGFRFRRIDPYGICVHTTGRTIVERALKAGRNPIDEVIAYYQADWKSHYVIGYGGDIFQFFPDTTRGAHIGVSAEERKRYLSGKWLIDFQNAVGVDLWRKRWSLYTSPQHLFPGTSPNGAYIGVELVPLLEEQDGLWFTPDQHQAVVDLCAERAHYHGWPTGWWATGCLVGHEDLDAYARWDKGGGWDPGALRVKPRFDWAFVRNALWQKTLA